MILKLQYPRQTFSTPPVPQGFAPNRECATSTASMPPSNINPGYMATQQKYVQSEQTLTQFSQQETSPANGVTLSVRRFYGF